jgi:hypothetical protein
MNYKDNVKEATTSVSAASFTPTGSPLGYLTFASAYADGATRIPVKVGPDSAGAWELGYYTLSGGVLTRNGVISSSAGGTTPVTFASGSKDVTVVYPASYAVDSENAVTLTNKRTQPRVVTVAQSATPAINSDLGDVFRITGLAQNITSMTSGLTGTPVHGEEIEIEITDNGGARNITLWGTKFASSTVTLPASTTAGAMLSVLLKWNSALNAGAGAWVCVGAQ